MSSTLKYALVIAVILLLASIPLAMKTGRGQIEGVITDDHGPLAHASVEARNVMSGSVFRADSNAAGRYKLEVPQGRYSLWVKAPAHDAEWIREVTVNEARATHRDIRLGRSETGAPIQSGAAD